MFKLFGSVVILALLFGYLQLQAEAAVRMTAPSHRRPNATHFTPALTHYPGQRPNFTHAAVAPSWNQSWYPAPLPVQAYNPSYPVNQIPVFGKSNATNYPAYNATHYPAHNATYYGGRPAYNIHAF